MKTSQFIVSAAEWYNGRTEKTGNAGFHDPSFEKELKSVGWYKGLAWCAFFTKLIYTKAYASVPLSSVIRNRFNGGALATYNNAKADGILKVSDVPAVGAIAVWQHGSSSAGHVGIVKSFDLKTNTMHCIEGNTNASGSREGDQVAIKARTIKRARTASGLNLKGFILPIEL
ncbi:hypothetical protein KO02_17470 [Sphingobacterium sp. ML3W]|uniref:CHAP domain-containing protein n=1 Tax=Sphingobacterium sp. ML3W TaxID=1538644 RepID=UPI0004F6A76C|nr:CHAP domain-containing protein [Sphingobacterium sp. ML3W]AIM38274.1 hypothetical protein KO02_17470 [Sphingobacterium sp. ML3W]